MDSCNESTELQTEESFYEQTSTVSNESMVSITEKLKNNDVTLIPIETTNKKLIFDDSISMHSELSRMSELSEIDNENINLLSSTVIEKNALNVYPLNNNENVNIMNSNTKQTCQICDGHFSSATKLVAHYVRNHSDADVYISRITQIYGNQVKNNTFDIILANKQTKCVCPFCEKVYAFAASKWVTHTYYTSYR